MTKRVGRGVYSMVFVYRRARSGRVDGSRRRLGTLRHAAIPIPTTRTMSATVERPPRHASRLSRRVVFGCLSFAIGGPLVASLVWPAVMLIAWTLIDGPSWYVLTVSAGMVPLIFVASFVFGYFLPAMATGGIMGTIGTQVRRRWFVLLGTIMGAGTTIGYVLLVAWMIGADKVGDINAIATLDAIVTSAVMSHWLHRRLERRR
ncbi:hypothetical protein LGM43_10030 [Burkholderia seminalis]|uniref:hypothetical protein n=1 Tax=Burkholderia seminalis TaxID=488731 RepID=UPI001CF257E2|nr:hypothetical protein [Burkholderia seminalis]MCA7950612.1 hypothetical protein [Burkholderia seminalis]